MSSYRKHNRGTKHLDHHACFSSVESGKEEDAVMRDAVLSVNHMSIKSTHVKVEEIPALEVMKSSLDRDGF